MKNRPAMNSPIPHTRKRPLSIAILSIFFLLLSLFYILKVVQVMRQWTIMDSLLLSISPLFLLLDGFVRGFSLGFLSWSFWTGRSWARIVGKIISLVLVLITWIDLIYIAEPNTLNTRWPFNLFISLVGLSGFWIFLNRASIQLYFGGNPAKIP